MANPANSVTVSFDILRELAYTSLSSSYVELGGVYASPARQIKIQNTTNVDIYVTDNGVDDKDKIPAGGFSLYDFCSNKSSTGGSFLQGQNTQVSVKIASGSATSGWVALTVITGANSY